MFTRRGRRRNGACYVKSIENPVVPGGSAALLSFFSGGAPALAGATTSAEFGLATCRPAMDDIETVDVLAREKNWIIAPSLSAPNSMGSS
jgi:hypothetical protein